MLTISPHYRAIQRCYEELRSYAMQHEGATSAAFQTLLSTPAPEVGRTLIPQQRLDNGWRHRPLCLPRTRVLLATGPKAASVPLHDGEAVGIAPNRLFSSSWRGGGILSDPRVRRRCGMPPYFAQGEVLRQAPERAGKSTQQVGDYLLIGGAAGYEPYERGDLSLSVSRISSLARYFGLGPKAFVAEVLSAR
jgi:hypothetical protein